MHQQYTFPQLKEEKMLPGHVKTEVASKYRQTREK